MNKTSFWGKAQFGLCAVLIHNNISLLMIFTVFPNKDENQKGNEVCSPSLTSLTFIQRLGVKTETLFSVEDKRQMRGFYIQPDLLSLCGFRMFLLKADCSYFLMLKLLLLLLTAAGLIAVSLRVTSLTGADVRSDFRQTGDQFRAHACPPSPCRPSASAPSSLFWS